MNINKYKTWDRVRVGKEFFDLLFADPLFLQYPKAINTSYYWLNAIQAGVSNNEGKPITWHYKDIENRFQAYNVYYTLFRDKLKDLGLITYSASYKAPKNVFTYGKCRHYNLTELGKSLILNSEKEYLYKLCKDPEVMRRNQKSCSKRKASHKTYSDPLLSHYNDIQNHITFDIDLIERQLAKETNKDKQLAIRSNLTQLKEKRFNALEFNVNAGNRVPNIITNFAKDYKVHLAYKNTYVYTATLDMRCCHATFLGELLFRIYCLLTEAINNETVKNLPVEICKRIKAVNVLAIGLECSQWTELFTQTKDPREVVGNTLSIELNVMKSLLNQWLNGKKTGSRKDKFTKKNINQLNDWFRREYPELNKVWCCIEREATGIWITEEFESPIFRNQSVYQYAKDKLDLIVNDENDGLGIRSRCTVAELPSKLNKLSDYLLTIGNEVAGFRITLTTKTIEKQT